MIAELELLDPQMLEVAEGMHYIHSEGIVHGDLRGVSYSLSPTWCLLHSPFYQDNILLDANFHVQIADFGLTRHVEATVTRSGALHYNFAAPELLGDLNELEDEFVSESEEYGQLTTRTQKSDIYAFGCLYYEVSNFDPLTGLDE